MRTNFSDLWQPSGTVDRQTYVIVGLVGFALKHNLDRLIATYLFHRPWGLFNYWEPLRNAGRVTDLRGDETAFLATLIATALPFIWVGVVLTLKRLRSAGLSPAWVVLFFAPFLNLFFFLVLSLLPECEAVTVGKREGKPFLQTFIPESALGSAAVAVLVVGLIGVCIVLLEMRLLIHYGWGLFVALPFTMGLAAAAIYGHRQPRSLPSCLAVAALSVGILGVGLLALAVEGVVCLIMAFPIAVPLALLGGTCGYFLQKQRWIERGAPAYFCMLLAFSPGVQWAEHVIAPKPQVFVVRSSIEINAPQEEVWKSVVAFSQIPPPKEWLFRAGVAYPIRAEIFGHGPGAERHCVFSTGAFVEPIEVWDEPRQLKFSVTSNPAPMQEWTPYSHIHPPHLHGFLVSEGGQFLLTPLPNGRTRLEGTTWYRHGLWPAPYWRLWSDAIIHRIHMRVLTHIRDAAVKEPGR
ncbi:MAG TPA: hypothetical protein VF133_09090 [Terriglobales bacterium]